MILPLNNSIVTEQNFLIDWESVNGAEYYSISLGYYTDNSGNHTWFWISGTDAQTDFVFYDGSPMESDKIYLLDISTQQSSSRIQFAYRETNRKTIYVDGSNATGTETGSQDYPFLTIQKAINATLPSDSILVNPGTYYENINLSNKENLLLGSLMLTTANPGFISQTIIDGNQNGSVFRIENCTDTIKIIGLTVRNGNADGQDGQGGGMRVGNSIVNLKYLNVIDNYAEQGGGFLFDQSNVELEHVSLKNNSANQDGAIHFGNIGKLILRNCEMSNNSTNGSASGVYIYNEECEIAIYNSLFSQNSGGECLSLNCTGEIINSTIAENQDGGVSVSENIQMINCILWGNDQNSNLNANNIQYSLVEGIESGEGNINTNPFFLDAESGNFRLQNNSPCINKGMPDTTDLNIGLFDLDNNPRISYNRIDMGAYESKGIFFTIQSEVSDADGNTLNNVSIKSFAEDSSMVESYYENELYVLPGIYTINYTLPGYFCQTLSNKHINSDTIFHVQLSTIGDYNLDGDLDYNDIDAFIVAWNNHDASIEFGPVTGTSPENFIVQPDGKIDFEDLIIFAMVWNSVQYEYFNTDVFADYHNPNENCAVYLTFNGIDTYDVILNNVEEYRSSNIFIQLSEGITIKNIQSGDIFNMHNNIALKRSYINENILEFNQAIVNESINLSNQTLLQFSIENMFDSIPEIIPVIYYEIRENNGYIKKGTSFIALPEVEPLFSLSQNFPNPVMSSTTKIRIYLPDNEYVQLKVYDMNGIEIIVLLNSTLEAGEHIMEWNTKDLKPGIYYYKLLSKNYSVVRKCLIIK